MNYKTLGKSGLRVSPVCLGTMTFGEEWGYGCTPAEAEKILNYFTEVGGNFIDTANVYNNGHAEKIIGDWIVKQPSRRSELVVGSKFSLSGDVQNSNGGGTSAKSMMENLHQSLRRLQTDYLDIYWLHIWDWNTPFEEVMRSLERVVASGQVRYLGISNTPSWKIAQSQMYAELKGWASFIGLQIEYSLLERTVEHEFIPMAMEMGMGITTYSPLARGILSGKYSNEKLGEDKSGSENRMNSVNLGEKELKILARLKEISENHNVSVSTVALAWILGKRGGSIPILGVRRLEQLIGNLESLNVKLSSEEMDSLDHLSIPSHNSITKHGGRPASFIHGGIEINGYKPDAMPENMQMRPGMY